MRFTLLIASALICACSPDVFATCISVGENNNAQICIKDGDISTRPIDGNITISPKLDDALHDLQSWVPVKNDFSENESIIYIEVASNPDSRGTGYCGAGHEGYLLLLRNQKKHIDIVDKQLIDSCLKSMSLTSDQGDDPHSAFQIGNGAHEVMTYDIITNGIMETKTVFIRNNKLFIK